MPSPIEFEIRRLPLLLKRIQLPTSGPGDTALPAEAPDLAADSQQPPRAAFMCAWWRDIFRQCKEAALAGPVDTCVLHRSAVRGVRGWYKMPDRPGGEVSPDMAPIEPAVSKSASTPPLVLRDEHLPAAFQATDLTSLKAQRRMVKLTALQLLLLIVSAAGGAVDQRLRTPSVDIGGVIATAGFVGTLIVGLLLSSTRPEKTWYRGRAGAESVKTLAWRYAGGGEPFEKQHLTEKQATRLFLNRLAEIVDQLRELDWPATKDIDQVTDQMRAIRQLDLQERMRSYCAGRLDNQIDWYRRKAAVAARRSTQWGWTAGLITVAGVAAGLARASTLIKVDLLGVLAAVVASATAWAQFKQFDVLASSYGLTAQQLGVVRADIHQIDNEDEWAAFVSQAEDGMSKEHTLWLTRRGVLRPDSD